MNAYRVVLPFALFTLLLAGCAGSSSVTDVGESVDHLEDLVTHLGRQGYILRPTGLTVPFSLADIGYEYRVLGERIRIYEFSSTEMAERAVDEFILDSSGGGTSSVFQHGAMMVAYAGRSPSLQLTLANKLGPAIY